MATVPIDANNLAGELNILDVDKFDLFLIKKIKQFGKRKNIIIDLVFDGADYFGDKSCNGNVNIIYTPKDDIYKCADDKIVEIFEEKIDISDKIIVVTSDVNLRSRMVEVLANFRHKNVEFQKSSDFVLKLEKRWYNEKVDTKLSEKEKRKINKELIDIYECAS